MSFFSLIHDFTHPDQFELLKHSSLARWPSQWLPHQLTSCPHVSARMSYQYQRSPWNVLSCSPQSYMTTAEDKTVRPVNDSEMWPASFDLFSTNLQNNWKWSSNEGTATKRDRLRLRSYWGLATFADLQQEWRYTSGSIRYFHRDLDCSQRLLVAPRCRNTSGCVTITLDLPQVFLLLALDVPSWSLSFYGPSIYDHTGR